MAFATNPKKNPAARRERPEIPSSNFIRFKGYASRNAFRNKYDAQTGKLKPKPAPEVKITTSPEETVPADVAKQEPKGPTVEQLSAGALQPANS